MTTRRTSSTRTRLVALAALVAFVASACGSGVATVAEDRALDPIVEISPRAPEPAPAPAEAPTAAATSANAGGHQYGTSIDEWTGGEQAQGAAIGQSDYAQIEWPELIPTGASGAELMARFEEQLDLVEPGSPEAAELWEQIQAEYNPAAVNTELEGQKVRLAGFVAPLTYEDDIVTEFLLVPTFGACIHVPPPPPNQTVVVSVDKEDGLTVDESWGAVWVEGTLVIDTATTDLAEASYKLTNATSGAYTDF